MLRLFKHARTHNLSCSISTHGNSRIQPASNGHGETGVRKVGWGKDGVDAACLTATGQTTYNYANLT